MKQNTKETIKLTEQVCAEGYYTERGRYALIDAIAAAYFLSAEDKETVLEAQQTHYTRLQEVRNALLLLGSTRSDEYREAVLRARADVLAQHQYERLPYHDKSSWLVYMNKTVESHNDDEQFEAACFLTAIGKRQEAYAKFVALAAKGDLSALWLALGLAILMKDEAGELRFITELTSLYDQGVIDYLPEDMAERQATLVANGFEAQSSRDFGGTKIGF